MVVAPRSVSRPGQVHADLLRVLIGSFVIDADKKHPLDALGEAFAVHRDTCGYATELAVRLLIPTALSAPRAALLQGGACVAASSPPESTPPDSTAPRIAAPRTAPPPGYIRAAQLSEGWCYPRVPLGAVPFETCTLSPFGQ